MAIVDELDYLWVKFSHAMVVSVVYHRSGNFSVNIFGVKHFVGPGTHENLFTHKINTQKIMCTLHAQAMMASEIEHVHQRACCVHGSTFAVFGTKTNTVLLI